MHKSNLTDLRDVHQIAGQSLHQGGVRTKINQIEWNISGSCTDPVRLEKYGRPEPTNGDYVTIIPGKTKAPFGVTMHAPCRHCESCLRSRRWEWHHRAMYELTVSPRTWFATLTLRPAARIGFLSRARMKAASQGEDLETYTEVEQFRKVSREVGQEISLYLARLRKHAGNPFRYLLVFERHKDGQPHMHGLIHETVAGDVNERLLRHQWRAGHSMFTLVRANEGSAGYVAKYLSKSNLARVRASLRYGKSRSQIIGGCERITTRVNYDPSPAARQKGVEGEPVQQGSPCLSPGPDQLLEFP